MSTIAIEVDGEAAKAYAAASPEEKRKLQLLLNLRLREILDRPPMPLKEVMDEIGAEAQTLCIPPGNCHRDSPGVSARPQ